MNSNYSTMPSDDDDSSRRMPTSDIPTNTPISLNRDMDVERPSLMQSLGGWLKETLGHKNGASLKEALEEILEEHDEDSPGDLQEEKILLRNMLAFGELTVSDVIVPRTDILAVKFASTLDELKQFVMEKQHTRMPVYQDNLDEIMGFIHLKDLMPFLASDEEFSMEKVMRDILFVPPSMRIVDLLMQMRLASCHMAIVVDEYGGTDGLVTMEDLFEEIVGDIQDEHDDEDSPEMVWKTETTLEADARVRIEDFEEELQQSLSGGNADDDYDTLGGMIFSELGRVPAKGEVVMHPSGLKFEILTADPRRIHKIRVIRSIAKAAH